MIRIIIYSLNISSALVETFPNHYFCNYYSLLKIELRNTKNWEFNMNEIIIKDIEVVENKYIISWDLKNKLPYLEYKDIDVTYSFNLSNNFFYPINILLSVLLPLVTIDSDKVNIRSSFPISESTLDYWTNLLRKLHKNQNILITCKNVAIATEEKENSVSKTNGNKEQIGLFFGGGVESMFALAKTIHKNPILLSIVGDQWMNNELDNYSIKLKLENELVDKYNLNIQKITTNIRTIVNDKDSFINKYSTGFMFYFLALPVTKEFNIQFLLETVELELALNFTDYDLSFNPRTIASTSFPEESYPIIFSAFTGHSKVQLFEELAQTDFINYLYSCYNNTDKRWCGTCGKCRRISKYCEVLGVDKKTIGMQEGIKAKREKSPLTKIHWLMMDNIYSHKTSFLKKIFK